MTAQEVVDNFDAVPSVKSLKDHWGKYQKKVKEKHGVQLFKTGRGETTQYFIVQGEETYKSIEVIKDIHQTVVMDQQVFTDLIDWDFMVFIGIITCPFMSFRGNYRQFLDYVGIKRKDADNIKRLKDTFSKLEQQGYIYFVKDNSTDEDYFGLFIKRKVETEMKIGIDMIQRCIKLQKQNNMKSWTPLLKVWLGLQLLVDQNINKNESTLFTLEELIKITGVNRNMVIKCKNVLEKDNLFQTSKAYQNYSCLGQTIDLNGIAFNYNRTIKKSDRNAAE